MLESVRKRSPKVIEKLQLKHRFLWINFFFLRITPKVGRQQSRRNQPEISFKTLFLNLGRGQRCPSSGCQSGRRQTTGKQAVESIRLRKLHHHQHIRRTQFHNLILISKYIRPRTNVNKRVCTVFKLNFKSFEILDQLY